jgi:RNA recognition motif-containing protein
MLPLLVQQPQGCCARCSLNFVSLHIGPITAHNQAVPLRGNVVKNLFVGNLGSEVTHEELRRLFEAYGPVVQVHIIVDRDTGMPRGFAFVEMTDDADAEKAIKGLNGSILRDRTLNVNYARPRPERPAA